MVLLKNADDLLPLRADTSVALIGPHFNATEDLISIYHGTVNLVHEHSPLQVDGRLSSRG